MLKYRNFVWGLLIVIYMSTTVLAASLQDNTTPEEGGVYIGDVKKEIPLGEPMIKALSGDEQDKVMPGDRQASKTDTRYTTRAETITVGTEQAQRLPLKKPKIILKVETGDSMVALSWALNGLNQRPGNTMPRFTVFYGIESGRYDKKFDVGSVTDYKVRFLRNNQIYYFKVQGTITQKYQEPLQDAEAIAEDLTFFSNEEKVIPVPQEERGSLLEKSFGSKTFTLQDKVDSEPFSRDLKQFGYDFFKNTRLAVTPFDSSPVGSDYVLGNGDSLRIDIWGSVQGRYELEVDRNGEITIPRVGNVRVWGANFGQAKEIVAKAISHYYKGFELNVTLGRLRTIQVFIVGQVESAGAYSVTSTATVINALALAGGPTKSGSLRDIRLTRGGKLVQEIDLYDMFLSGDRSRDFRLENGDTVFVPVVGAVAGVAGEVKRPAIYELKGKTTLWQLLSMAGGATALGDLGRVQVERFEPKAGRVVSDLDLQSGKDDPASTVVQVMDRDMIKVFPVMQALRQVVMLQGNVVRPGEYQYRKGMRVSDLLPSFTAILPDAYLETAQVIRLLPPDFHRETIAINLGKVLAGDPQENIALQEQDTIKVFSRMDMVDKPTVAINGMVVNPGTYDYYPNMTIRDLVSASGSLKRNAFMDKAELTRILLDNGVAKSERVDIDLGKAMAGDPQHNLTIKPDDVLIVRGIQEWLESSDRFITIQGEVRFPGTYSITKGERLSSVIKRAGGFSDKSYMKGARFFRKSVQRDQQKRMDEFIQRAEQDIMKKQGELSSVAASREELEATKAALEGLQKNLERLKTLKAEGRVVISLSSIDKFINSPSDIELQGGDLLNIPSRSSVVNVLGQVYNQTSFIYKPGEKLSYYLERAGGVTGDAEKSEMYIISADGSVFSRQQSTFGIKWDDNAASWSFGSFMATPLQPGDTLVIPQKLERTAWLRDIKDITQILANVALTAGTILIGLR